MTGRAEVLIVCAGNACRSPVAEVLLREGIDTIPGVASWCSVRSAGIEATAGAPIDDRTREALSGIGVDPGEFRATPLHRSLVQDSALILTATRRHRSGVVRLEPTALPRSFTIAELARFARALMREEGPADRDAPGWDRLVRFATAHRGVILPEYLDDDDIGDPRGRPQRAHDAMVREIVDCISDILEVVAGVGDPPPVQAPSGDDPRAATVRVATR